MTLDEITEIDKEVLAARYEAAVAEEFGALAKFLDTTIEAMLARSRAASREALVTAEDEIHDVGVNILQQIEEAIRWRTTDLL